jgi:hypothetical protein
VVLLSLFSIFLCGMMVAFVGGAKNYKQGYVGLQQDLQYAQAELTKKDEQFNTQAFKYKELENRLLDTLATLETEKNQLTADLRKSERLSAQYQSQADSWKGVMTGFEQSVRNLQASLQQTQQQLDTARSQGINDRKELNQITADLYAKIVQLQSMEAERRRLLEQKTELENQISSLSTGAAVEVRPVTPLVRSATPASTTTAAADIKGVVKDVAESLVHLSIGSADGVRENMVFHITRGEQFLCDVVVTNVDIDQSAGVLQLVQQRPRAGDTASTQL